MAQKKEPGTMKGWGHWGGPKHPGVSMVLATVLVIVSSVLEIYHVKDKLKKDANPTDLVAAANFAFVIWTFVIMFLSNDWRLTFKLHAFLSFCLCMIFGILSAIENAAIREDTKIDNSLYTLSLVACILAWCALICLGQVLYCCFWSTFVKRFEKRDFTFFVSIASFFLSCLAFALWLNSSTLVALSPIMSNWVHGLFIAGTMFALVASISYLFGIISDGAILDLYAGIASITLLIFAIGGLALLPDNEENPKFLSAIASTFFNVLLLLYLARKVVLKFWAQSWSGRILVLTFVLAVIQFSLAMTKSQPNTTAIQVTPVINKASWWLGILSAGFASTIAAAFFSTIKKHLPTSLNFNFVALLAYVSYFVAECYYFDKDYKVTSSYDFIHRKTIAAISLAAAIIVLLFIAVVIKLGGYQNNCTIGARIVCRSFCYTVIVDERSAYSE
ncbi:unnamed protein product [Oikopleura dioica]|uniref:Uncharacterized protein n=1 Tax=Oikopleura dioica TaxID=34765 RepID=E4X7B3_OIKDI|nr:unnamed protein product [Oikopleura dioica]